METVDPDQGLRRSCMALSPESPPVSSVRKFRKWADHQIGLVNQNAQRPAKLAEKKSNKTTTRAAHSIYVLTIPQLVAGKSLRSAKRVAWHHFRLGASRK